MEVALSTQLTQDTLRNEVGVALIREQLDAHQQDGQNVLALIAAARSITDPQRGQHIDVSR